jgi:hypothetical protein
LIASTTNPRVLSSRVAGEPRTFAVRCTITMPTCGAGPESGFVQRALHGRRRELNVGRVALGVDRRRDRHSGHGQTNDRVLDSLAFHGRRFPPR